MEVTPEKGNSNEDKTEVSRNGEDVDDDNFFDAEDEEQKTTDQIDEIAAETKTNLMKLESPIKEGPEEVVDIKMITDYSDFATIDKLDKNTYITDEHRNYVATEQDIFILIKKTGLYQRLIWGEPVALKEQE